MNSFLRKLYHEKQLKFLQEKIFKESEKGEYFSKQVKYNQVKLQKQQKHKIRGEKKIKKTTIDLLLDENCTILPKREPPLMDAQRYNSKQYLMFPELYQSFQQSTLLQEDPSLQDSLFSSKMPPLLSQRQGKHFRSRSTFQPRSSRFLSRKNTPEQSKELTLSIQEEASEHKLLDNSPLLNLSPK